MTDLIALRRALSGLGRLAHRFSDHLRPQIPLLVVSTVAILAETAARVLEAFDRAAQAGHGGMDGVRIPAWVSGEKKA